MNLDGFYFFRIFEGVEKYFEKKMNSSNIRSIFMLEYSTNLETENGFKIRRIFDSFYASNIRRIYFFHKLKMVSKFVEYSMTGIFEGFETISKSKIRRIFDTT